MTILHVEDCESIRELFAALLGAEHDLIGVETLDEALRVIAGGVDLVLCDGTFPLRAHRPAAPHWREVVEAARERATPVIIISGDALIVEEAQSLNVAALRKPVAMDELQTLVRLALRRAA